MNIPPLDLKRQYKQIKKQVRKRIDEVCDSQYFVLGKTVSDFEERVAEYCGAKYGIGCANGTDAILLSLTAAGVEKGDEVIVPSFTFIASAEPIVRVGGTPVFCDVDEMTYNMNPKDLEKKITKKTKAIVVVHLYGQTADMQPIMKIARKHKLKVIEDSAQAIGAVYGPNGKKPGAFGDMATFSFFPSKNLGGFGDGGMIVTDKKKYNDLLKMLRVHGSNKRYYHDIMGMNSRLDALQAAVLDVKFDYLDGWLDARVKKAEQYNKLLKNIFGEEIITPYVEKGNTHTYHQYVLRLKGVKGKKRDALVAYLQENGIGANVYYPVPCHQQKCFSSVKLKKSNVPVTEKLSKEIFALPIYPELTNKEQKYIVDAIQAFVNA